MEADGKHDRQIVGTRRCSKEIGGSCEEISYDAASIKDDRGRNQIRDIKGSDEMKGTDADETNEKMGAENVSGNVCVLSTRRKTATSRTSLDMHLRRDPGR